MSVRILALLSALLLPAAPLRAQDPPDVTEPDLEDLLNVRVTSVGRKPQSLSAVPAAVCVIGGDELRRTGATSLPEALRGVPGVQVARVRSHGWAVTARGFNDVFANKLLVLVDGRGGTEERAYGGGRYGIRIGADACARVWAQHVERDDLADGLDDARQAHDAWFQSRAGFRADAKTGTRGRAA